MADDLITLGLNCGERECVDCIHVGLCRFIHMEKEQPCAFRKTADAISIQHGRLINAEALKSHYSWLGEDTTLTKKDIDDIVDAQPPVDAAPVVRCRDCVHFGECLVTESDYCSKGERKENKHGEINYLQERRTSRNCEQRRSIPT